MLSVGREPHFGPGKLLFCLVCGPVSCRKVLGVILLDLGEAQWTGAAFQRGFKEALVVF